MPRKPKPQITSETLVALGNALSLLHRDAMADHDDHVAIEETILDRGRGSIIDFINEFADCPDAHDVIWTNMIDATCVRKGQPPRHGTR